MREPLRSEAIESQTPGPPSWPQRVRYTLGVARRAPEIAAGWSNARVAREEVADVMPHVGRLGRLLFDVVETDEAVAGLQALIFDGDPVTRRERDDARVGRAAVAIFCYFWHPTFPRRARVGATF